MLTYHSETLGSRKEATLSTMKINGREQSLEGKTFSDIGTILQQSSPNGDGLGLVVELTQYEEVVFCSHVGMTVGYAICELIADAIKAAGGNPKIRYNYSNLIFKTFPA